MAERPFLAGVAAIALLTCIAAAAAEAPSDAIALVRAFAAGDTTAFAAGEPVRLFMVSEVRTQNVFRAGGLQLESHNVDHLLVFLPRGVLLGVDAGRSTVGSWRSVADGFEVTVAGKTTALRLSRGQNGQNSMTAFGLTYREVPRPTDSSLAGRYETMNATSAGGGALASVSSYGHQTLLLTPDHRFEKSAASSTTASDNRFVAHAGHSDVLRGKWQYEPASFTLTLEPEGGKPALAGPTFQSPSGWSILGQNTWWRVDGPPGLSDKSAK